jgi:hypothetical protein
MPVSGRLQIDSVNMLTRYRSDERGCIREVVRQMAGLAAPGWPGS